MKNRYPIKQRLANTPGANRAVIYCRVSTKDQVENFSLATQEKACREFCARSNFVVDRMFVEEGESAKTANRTEFKKLLTYCRESKGAVNWLVVYRLDRFSRRQEDHHALRALLVGFGVTLRSVSDPIDETSTGKLMEGIFAAINQFDNDVRAERTVAGMRAAIQSGKWTFKAPLGYLNSLGENGNGSLVPDPERGPLIAKAFHLFSAGLHTKRKVLEMVTAMGLRTLGGKPVANQTFNQLLLKPVYAGWVHVPAWGEPVRGDFEPLVRQEIFDRVQAILKGKQGTLTPHLRSHPDFPLRHFVRCGSCGKPLTASWSKGRTKRYPYYRCQNRVCKGVNVHKHTLEASFVGLLERLRPKDCYAKLFRETVLHAWSKPERCS